MDATATRKQKLYFTMNRAKRITSRILQKHLDVVSDAQLQKDFVTLRDYVRFIETEHWSRHSFMQLIDGGYFRSAASASTSGITPVDPWLYQTLKYALEIAIKELTKRRRI